MKMKIKLFVFCLVVSVVNTQDNLVPQNINFTEFIGDISNPDRGFCKPEVYVGRVPCNITQNQNNHRIIS
jgi:hypothetical protein